MTSSSHDPVAIFDNDVPGGFLEASVRSLKDCYERAHRQCLRNYPREVAHDLRPYLRRAEFEKEWALVAESHSGITCGFYTNVGRNCYHVRVQSGRVILTASFVDARVRAVRRAMFRDTYARRNETFLFADMAPTPPPEGAPLYAILMHDAASDDQSALLYADVISQTLKGRS